MTYTNIEGRSRETAEALLAAAEKLRIDAWEIRTTIRGYVVPDAVAAEYQKMLAGESEPVSEEPVADEAEEPAYDEAEEATPDESWKNADIEAWAQAHEVDLGGATKKADMLAAIQAADTEEG